MWYNLLVIVTQPLEFVGMWQAILLRWRRNVVAFRKPLQLPACSPGEFVPGKGMLRGRLDFVQEEEEHVSLIRIYCTGKSVWPVKNELALIEYVLWPCFVWPWRMQGRLHTQMIGGLGCMVLLWYYFISRIDEQNAGKLSLKFRATWQPMHQIEWALCAEKVVRRNG